ncbi:MAG TPA: DUF4185 domain-containing protein [Terracidiphilus sp.]|nr:DUF4185 domain-containing protein [Terracidiphilus sp.]
MNGVLLISRKYFRATILLALLVIAGRTAFGEKYQDCTPSFPFKQQWLGADDAYSIPLKDERDVWIFGDTLYGRKRVIVGDEPRMVRNTIGISTCKAGKWNIDYVIRKDAHGNFRDFFEPQHPKTWYWPMDGVEINGELWVTLLCVRNSPEGVNNGFGFELCGTDLAHVTGLEHPAQKWKISYQPLAKEDLHANPTSSAVVKDGFLYLYANADEQKAIQLTRIPVAGLVHAEEAMEYLGRDGEWHKGYQPKEAMAVMEPGASEMSVRYHPAMKQWVSVLLNPDLFSGGEVWVRFAPKMRGPWSKPEVVYHVPEMNTKSIGYDKDIFCYAGKEHPEFEKSGELIFTYACNMMKPKKLETRTDIYFPKVVQMAMPSPSMHPQEEAEK